MTLLIHEDIVYNLLMADSTNGSGMIIFQFIRITNNFDLK